MSDLVTEIGAIQSIYGKDVLRDADGASVYILSIPYRDVSLRVLFPPDYAESTPQLLGIETTGAHARKGYGSHVLDTARATLLSVFVPGSVCLFDLLQELETALAEESNGSNGQRPSPFSPQEDTSSVLNAGTSAIWDLGEEPCWILSLPVTEKKSTFVARACSVTSPAQAQACIARLLDTDKRAAKASHNISAFRIRALSTTESMSEVTYQDCDDDGETAAGGRLLHLLRVMNVWDVLVVVSRWYGGVKLGPDRFSIINNVAREAVVKGGWTKSGIMKD
ncbi:MAG: eIF2 kinase Gcn2p negative regulator [Alectoria fallacina]|uniref:EIF2 kinase Gcn2p negative regulator n=1 Tax=Alectoria fallacina TaxID=1903189 RepID=A0A8H3J936_9LECA|nr:MAG: eIF2 kinase Gcn2p negative regulator [Alectoria fallacina]